MFKSELLKDELSMDMVFNTECFTELKNDQKSVDPDLEYIYTLSIFTIILNKFLFFFSFLNFLVSCGLMHFSGPMHRLVMFWIIFIYFYFSPEIVSSSLAYFSGDHTKIMKVSSAYNLYQTLKMCLKWKFRTTRTRQK